MYENRHGYETAHANMLKSASMAGGVRSSSPDAGRSPDHPYPSVMGADVGDNVRKAVDMFDL